MTIREGQYAEDGENASPGAANEDGAAILDAMVEEIRRHTVLGPHYPETIALWIFHAHAIDAFRYSARLSVRSPVPNCGKTTLQAVIRALCGERGRLYSNLTIAAFFRFVDGASKAGALPPVMIIDEVDTFISQDRKEVVGILNSGHDREGANILRCLNQEANHEPRSFSTWAPVVLGGIGALPAAPLESRCIVINLDRKRTDEQVEKFREAGKARCAALASQAAAWCQDHLDELRNAEPEVPPGLYDRARDSWETLIAIADAAGGRWPEIARTAALTLNGEAEDPSEGVMLLRDSRDAFTAGMDRITSASLLAHLHGLTERPWGAEGVGGVPSFHSRQLCKLLKGFQIRPKDIRLPGGNVQKGFLRSQFEDAWARYLPIGATGEGEPVAV
jgi:hypothetical protein